MFKSRFLLCFLWVFLFKAAPSFASRDLESCVLMLTHFIGDEFSRTLGDILARMRPQSAPQLLNPQVLVVGGGEGYETVLVAAQLRQAGLGMGKLVSLERDEANNIEAARLFGHYLEQSPNLEKPSGFVQLWSRDASLDETYLDLPKKYDLIVLRNPDLLSLVDGPQFSKTAFSWDEEPFYGKDHWAKVFQQVVPRLQENGTFLMSFTSAEELIVAEKILSSFPGLQVQVQGLGALKTSRSHILLARRVTP